MYKKTYTYGGVGAPRADPYFEWSCRTDWKLYGTQGEPAEVPVLLEFKNAGDAAAATETASPRNPDTNFRYAQSPELPPSRFVSAVIQTRDFLNWQRRSDVRRVQLMLARTQQGDPASQRVEKAGQVMAAHSTRYPTDVAANLAEPDAVNAEPRPIGSSDEPLVILGAIDDGCCLAHEELRSRNGPVEVLGVWDQGVSPAGPWRKNRWLPYGSELTYQRIRSEIAAWEAVRSVAPPEDAERIFYAKRLHRPYWGDRTHAHGAGVLHVLTGQYPLPYNPVSPPTLQPEPSPHPVLFVQLPRPSVFDTSGGAIGRDVLDGIRYIVQRAKREAQQRHARDWHAVVSVSFGGLAGPHDGSSIAEQAIDELVEAQGEAQGRPRVFVVVAAGNGAEERFDPKKGIHASRRVSNGAAGCFNIFVPSQCDRETYVEFWLKGATELDLDTLSAFVTPPGSTRPARVQPGSACNFSKARDAEPAAALLFARQVVQGLNGTMCLLAIRAEHAGTSGSVQAGQSGFWQVRFESPNERGAALDVQAWIERNDSVGLDRKPQRSNFVEDGTGYVSDDHTLSSLANGQRTLVVGAFTRSTQRVARYSGRGHKGLTGTDGPKAAYGPGDNSASSRGVLVPGFFSGQWEKVRGTSIAAPRVARELAHHLSRGTEPEPAAQNPRQAAASSEAQLDPIALKAPPGVSWPTEAPQALGFDG